MNWIKRIFNWKKAPKATNEMKPAEISKYFRAYLAPEEDIFNAYFKVKKSWKRSPKNYSVYYRQNDDTSYKIVNNNSISKKSFQDKNNVIVGNLYTLYQQYYGKENKD